MAICKDSAQWYKPEYIEYVYSLRCPISYDIFYVGKTNDLNGRLNGHIGDGKAHRLERGNQEKAAVINKILTNGLKPIMRIIDKTDVRTPIDKFEACYKEIKWIQFYLQIGWALTNVKDIATNLDSTDYKRYYSNLKNGEPIDIKYYYFGKNNLKEDIYDLKRLKEDGFNFPLRFFYPDEEPKRDPFEGGYNPYKNPRFVKAVGEENIPFYYRQNRGLAYVDIYNDLNPIYYEQDDCMLFY